MPQQNINGDDFDFKKIASQKIDQNMKKVDTASYKKLAFLAVAVGVFVSTGVFFANYVAPTILHHTHIMESVVPSNEVVNNINKQLTQLSSTDFDNTVTYYQNVMNMYDNKLDYVNKTLIDYNLQAGGLDAEVSQDSLKKMAGAISDHKENISDTITKFNSLKNKILAHDNLSYNDAQFVLNAVEKARQHVIYQNSEVDSHFNKNLVATPKDITKYLTKVNAYDKIKALDNDIKASFQSNNSNTNNPVKPKM